MKHQKSDDRPLELKAANEEPRAQAFQDMPGSEPFSACRCSQETIKAAPPKMRVSAMGGTVPRAIRAPQTAPASVVRIAVSRCRRGPRR